ncbi:MAG: hypothetical protein ACI9PN_002830, partial [Candidatus Azotimanducaceae bacterium]
RQRFEAADSDPLLTWQTTTLVCVMRVWFADSSAAEGNGRLAKVRSYGIGNEGLTPWCSSGAQIIGCGQPWFRSWLRWFEASFLQQQPEVSR